MNEYRTDAIKADGKTLVTAELQQMIDKAHEDKATLIITKGKYLTASIFIRSNMNVVLEEGAELIGTTDEKEYPVIDTRIAGIEMKAYPGILNVNDAENVRISGHGTVSGQGRYWWNKYWGEDEKSGYRGEYDVKGLRWAADYDCRRLRNIVVMNSKNVEIKDIISSEPGFWNLHVLYSEHIVIDGVFINAIISFVVIAFCVFCVVKGFNKLHDMKKKEEEAKPAAPAAPPADIQLLTEIRDLLKKNS